MKDIFYQFKDANKIGSVLIPWIVAKDLKPGTPVSAAGAVANDDDAVGLLLHHGDVGMTVIVNGEAYLRVDIATGGYVDLNAVEELSGLTLSDDCKAALSNIVFVSDGMLHIQTVPVSEASDGGKVLTVDEGGDPAWVEPAVQIMNVAVTHEESTYTLGEKWEDIFEAAADGHLIRTILRESTGATDDSVHFEYVEEASFVGSDYVVVTGEREYTTDAEDGYPSYTPATNNAEAGGE